MILLLFLALAISLSYARSGRLSNLSQARLQYGFLIVIALAIKVTLLLLKYPFSDSSPGLAVFAHLASYLVLAAFLLLNWQLKGMKVMAFGLMLNFVAILSSGAFMIHSAGSPIALAATKNVAAAATASVPGTSLLDSFFYLPYIPFTDAVSIGSLLVGFGVFIVVGKVMLSEPEPQPARGRYQPKHLVKHTRHIPLLKRAV